MVLQYLWKWWCGWIWPRFVFHQHCVSRDPHLLRSRDTWAVFGCALSLVAVQNLWIILEINILPSPLDSFIFYFKLDSTPPPLLVFNKLCFKLPSELICPEITVASKRGSENDKCLLLQQVNKTVQILLAQDLRSIFSSVQLVSFCNYAAAHLKQWG